MDDAHNEVDGSILPHELFLNWEHTANEHAELLYFGVSCTPKLGGDIRVNKMSNQSYDQSFTTSNI